MSVHQLSSGVRLKADIQQMSELPFITWF